MRLDGANKERLRELYETKLAHTEKVSASFSPAKHRSTQVDVERTIRGTSDIPSRPLPSPARSRRTGSPTYKPQAKGCSQQRTTAPDAASLEPPIASLYQTDYCTSASLIDTQHQLAHLAATKLALQTTSEWAMLTTLEHTAAQEEEYAKQTAKKQHQHEQRLQLDQQVAEHQHAQELALAAKAAELASVKADVQAYQVQEAAKLATAEQAAQKLKAEQLKQTAAAEAARKRQAAKKEREEAALLSAIKRQMTEAQEAAAMRAADMKAAAEAAKKANEEAKLAKHQATRAQQQKDEELMRETIKTLQKQEEAREAALKAFHDMIAARAAHAGAAAAAENKSRQEREERLVAASEAKAKAEAEARHAAEIAKRAAMAADRQASAAAAAAAKVAAEQLRKQEQFLLRAKMDADLQQYQQLEALTSAQRKAKNQEYKQALEAQISEAEKRQVLDDVFMSERERQLNRQLITHARNMMSSLTR